VSVCVCVCCLACCLCLDTHPPVKRSRFHGNNGLTQNGFTP
jgi:hypothetical protein